MTENNVLCEQHAKRCAVCKIDLKGRFVYVDDATERLTGFTKEELFGKSILDLVTESGHAVIKQALYHRNHYESTFDSVRLEIIDRNKRPRPATVILSLNFIAGNPVNFQVIIDLDTPAPVPTPESGSDYQLRDLVHELLVIEPERYEKEAQTVLSEYLCRYRPTVYRYHGQGNCDLVSSSTSSRAGALPQSGAKEITALLNELAETRDTYRCDEPACIQRAIELLGFAPHELIMPLSLSSTNLYLIRVLLDESTREGELGLQIADSRQAIQLVERLSTARTAATAIEPEIHSDREKTRLIQSRDNLHQTQLALTGAMQLLNRLDKLWRAK